MKTYIVKVEYRTPSGSHMKYNDEHTGHTKAEAMCNAFSHLALASNRKIDANVRIDAQLKGDTASAMA